MANDESFDPEDANVVAMGLASIVAKATETFGGYAAIGGLSKFNLDFIAAGIASGEMDPRLMRMLAHTHDTMAKMLTYAAEHAEKEQN